MVVAFLVIGMALSCLIPGITSLVQARAEELENQQNYVNCENVIEFVDNNFSTFVSEYNNTIPCDDDKLQATEIEYSTVIHFMSGEIDDNTYAAYLDFNGNNGYAVITADYVIHCFEINDDLPNIRQQNKEFCFSTADGLGFIDENGYFSKFNQNPSEIIENQIEFGYDQSANGDGEIKDFYSYRSDNYPNYSLIANYEDVIALDFDYGTQYELSYYIQQPSDANKNNDNSRVALSEGNCSLTAMFNTLRYMSKKLNLGIDYTSTVDIRQSIQYDSIYNEYIGRDAYLNTYNGVTGYYYWKKNSDGFLSRIPKLYHNIRKHAINGSNPYRPDTGYLYNNVPSTMTATAMQDYNVGIAIHFANSITEALPNLRNGIPSYLSIQGSSTYGNHGVCLIGYREYSYTSGWWIFETTKYAYFYQIADGWNDEFVYFDPNTSASLSLSTCIYAQ